MPMESRQNWQGEARAVARAFWAVASEGDVTSFFRPRPPKAGTFTRRVCSQRLEGSRFGV
jgi:hypothetical protein